MALALAWEGGHLLAQIRQRDRRQPGQGDARGGAQDQEDLPARGHRAQGAERPGEDQRPGHHPDAPQMIGQRPRHEQSQDHRQGRGGQRGPRGALLDAEHARELGKQRLHEVDQREVRQTAQREHCEHSAIARRPRREPLLRSAHRHASSPPCLVSSSGRGRRSIRLIESVLATVSIAGLSVTQGMDRHKVNLRHMLGSAAASRPPQHPQHRTPLTARSG